jgi:hypothetical protein
MVRNFIPGAIIQNNFYNFLDLEETIKSVLNKNIPVKFFKGI